MSITTVPRIRKFLAIDTLIQGLRKRFEAIPDPACRQYDAFASRLLHGCLREVFAQGTLASCF